MRYAQLKALVRISAMLVLSGQILYAQITGGILGTVTDPSGAAISDATVTMRNADTGLERRVQTNASGSYEFLAVPVGENYSVRVEAGGFRATVENGIKLDINQKYRADFKLAVGAANQTIEVTGVSAQVDTTSTQLGDVIGSQKMTSLPLNGRSYIDLLGLQAGVVPVSSEGAISDRNVSGNLSAGQVSVNGQRESANNHAQFLNPTGEINSNFGQITGARDGRIGQVALKLSF